MNPYSPTIIFQFIVQEGHNGPITSRQREWNTLSVQMNGCLAHLFICTVRDITAIKSRCFIKPFTCFTIGFWCFLISIKVDFWCSLIEISLWSWSITLGDFIAALVKTKTQAFENDAFFNISLVNQKNFMAQIYLWHRYLISFHKWAITKTWHVDKCTSCIHSHLFQPQLLD